MRAFGDRVAHHAKGPFMKRIQRSSIRLVFVLVGLLWLLPSVQYGVAQAKVSIIANLILGPTLLPLWIANEQGLFVKQGVEPEVVLVEGDVSRRIGNGIPFGVIGIPAAMSAVSDGRDLKVVVTLDAP